MVLAGLAVVLLVATVAAWLTGHGIVAWGCGIALVLAGIGLFGWETYHAPVWDDEDDGGLW